VTASLRVDTVVLDVDGTLIDSNYHHTLAWARAFEHVGVTVSLWRIHRAIGMGGDKLVTAVAGDEVEREHGDDVRDRWEREYDAIIGETLLLPGAKELVEEALSRMGGGTACVIGDSVWDVKAAKRAGVPAYGVLSGGTSRAEDAGAVAVYEDARELLDRLDEWLR
jgi:phosphoglycolate phosphatase-like HAD superfamily hydrolase